MKSVFSKAKMSKEEPGDKDDKKDKGDKKPDNKAGAFMKKLKKGAKA